MNDATGMAHSEQQAKLSEAAVQHLLGNGAGSGMAWAGAAHWRYRTRAAARPAAAEGGEAGAEAPAAKPATRSAAWTACACPQSECASPKEIV